MEQLDVRFSNGRDSLAGSVVKPRDQLFCHSVVLVHGSGPETRSGGTTTVAFRDHLLSRGYAVLSWDKPGTGKSTGDWRHQTFNDRALEVAAAVNFLKSQPFARSRQVGLLGWSQAGWVMPIVTQLVGSVSFVVSISGPAVPPMEQERYRVESQLRADKFSEDKVSCALETFSRVVEMTRAGVTAERIMSSLREEKNESWFEYLGLSTTEILNFFMANLWFDPLPYLRQVKCPFLGMWGELDTFVPVRRSMELTRDALTAAGNTRFVLELIPRASHRMRLSETGSPSETSPEVAPGLLQKVSHWLDATLV